MLYHKQELLTCEEHIGSSRFFYGIRVPDVNRSEHHKMELRTLRHIMAQTE